MPHEKHAAPQYTEYFYPDSKDRSKMETMKDVEYLSDLLDTKFSLPFGFKIGWDGILGLIPGVGDAVTSIFSFYILGRAASLGASVPILLRMGLNIAIDNFFNAIPLFGNIADIFWKSNKKNADLLKRYMEDHRTTTRRSSVVIGLVLVAIFATLVSIVVLSGYIAYKLIGLVLA